MSEITAGFASPAIVVIGRLWLASFPTRGSVSPVIALLCCSLDVSILTPCHGWCLRLVDIASGWYLRRAHFAPVLVPGHRPSFPVKSGVSLYFLCCTVVADWCSGTCCCILVVDCWTRATRPDVTIYTWCYSVCLPRNKVHDSSDFLVRFRSNLHIAHPLR